ncbi:MAG TPA: Lrp/AsnC ligand binding domain-containing protein [Chloroflexota bacterium]|nr:Lrp/AsnC ligand binding domain-containing protein [Chloroflexota bacterium]
MRLSEVLAAVPGLEKRFVHYLEGQGYIRPTKLQKARIARRDYAQADLERIRSIWRYYQRGISIQRAWELVTRPADGAYVFFPVASRRWHDAIDLLRSQDNVIEASAVYGDRYDALAHLRVPHDSDVYAVLDALFEGSIISGLPQILRHGADAVWTKPATTSADTMVRAWVLIKVPAKQLDGLVELLRGFPGIVEASAIYGETDVIAKIEVDDAPALDDLVVNRIQGIDVVESTRTFIGIGGLHWARS